MTIKYNFKQTGLSVHKVLAGLIPPSSPQISYEGLTLILKISHTGDTQIYRYISLLFPYLSAHRDGDVTAEGRDSCLWG